VIFVVRIKFGFLKQLRFGISGKINQQYSKHSSTLLCCTWLCVSWAIVPVDSLFHENTNFLVGAVTGIFKVEVNLTLNRQYSIIQDIRERRSRELIHVRCTMMKQAFVLSFTDVRYLPFCWRSSSLTGHLAVGTLRWQTSSLGVEWLIGGFVDWSFRWHVDSLTG